MAATIPGFGSTNAPRWGAARAKSSYRATDHSMARYAPDSVVRIIERRRVNAEFDRWVADVERSGRTTAHPSMYAETQEWVRLLER